VTRRVQDRRTKRDEGKFTISAELVGAFLCQCRSVFIDMVHAFHPIQRDRGEVVEVIMQGSGGRAHVASDSRENRYKGPRPAAPVIGRKKIQSRIRGEVNS